MNKLTVYCWLKRREITCIVRNVTVSEVRAQHVLLVTETFHAPFLSFYSHSLPHTLLAYGEGKNKKKVSYGIIGDVYKMAAVQH